jgi:hypothetical protein
MPTRDNMLGECGRDEISYLSVKGTNDGRSALSLQLTAPGITHHPNSLCHKIDVYDLRGCAPPAVIGYLIKSAFNAVV